MSLDQTRSELSRRIGDLARKLIPDGSLEGKEWVGGGRRVYVEGLRAGSWKCEASGEGGRDPLALVSLVRGIPEDEALDWADAWLSGSAQGNGHAPTKPAPRAILPEDDPPQRPPPRSTDEVERAMLSSILQRPEILDDERPPTVEHFWNPICAEIFLAIRALRASGAPVDFVSLSSAMSADGRLDRVGGMAALSDLWTFVPSAANWQHYRQELEDARARRELRRIGDEMVRRAHDQSTSTDDHLAWLSEQIAALSEPVRTRVEVFSHQALSEFRSDQDPDCLIGDRYICRGGSCLIVGKSGIGKSSFSIQFACHLALGEPFCGIVGKRGMRSLIIQAENDLGDMAEVYQGVTRSLAAEWGTPVEEIRKLLGDKIVFYRDATNTAADFGRSLRKLIEIHKPDLVWIDPLLAYVGDDISQIAVASDFLRHVLNPISIDTGVAFMVCHHTGKPPKDSKAQQHWSDLDQSYAGLGSSELTNWARGVMVLSEVGGGFKLILAKRGRRACATHPDGEPATTVYLRHASYPNILWVQMPPPDSGGESVAKDGADRVRGTGSGKFVKEFHPRQILELMPPEGIRVGKLQKLCYEELGMSRSQFYSMWEEIRLAGDVQDSGDRNWRRSDGADQNADGDDTAQGGGSGVEEGEQDS